MCACLNVFMYAFIEYCMCVCCVDVWVYVGTCVHTPVCVRVSSSSDVMADRHVRARARGHVFGSKCQRGRVFMLAILRTWIWGVCKSLGCSHVLVIGDGPLKWTR